MKHGDFLEEVDKQDKIRLQGRAKGMQALAEIASFPPLRTPHFNEDGDNRFRSKIQICIFGPSVLIIFLIIILNIYPFINKSVMDTTIQNLKIDYGFDLISNKTEIESIPINKYYSSIYRLFNKSPGLQESRLVDYSEFSEGMTLYLKDNAENIIKDA